MTITRIAESAVTSTRFVKSGTAATQCSLCGPGETPIGVSANSAGTGELVTIYPISGEPAGVTATDSIEFLSASGWTSTNWTGGWVAGWAHTTWNTSALSYPKAPVAGRRYTITWVVSSHTAGTFSIAFGGSTIPTLSKSGSVTIEATTTDGLTVTPVAAFRGTLALSIKCSRIQFGDAVAVAAGGLAQTYSTGSAIGTAISDANTGETLSISYGSSVTGSGTGSGTTVINIVSDAPTDDPGLDAGKSAFALHYTTSFQGLYFWNGSAWEQLV